MVLDRLLGDTEALADLPVGQAVADEVEHLALCIGQVGGGVVVVGPPARDGALVEQDSTGGDRPHDIAFLSQQGRLLTTEKDYVRLGFALPQLYYLPIETQFLNEKDKEMFDKIVLSFEF